MGGQDIFALLTAPVTYAAGFFEALTRRAAARRVILFGTDELYMMAMVPTDRLAFARRVRPILRVTGGASEDFNNQKISLFFEFLHKIFPHFHVLLFSHFLLYITHFVWP